MAHECAGPCEPGDAGDREGAKIRQTTVMITHKVPARGMCNWLVRRDI